MNPIKDQTWRKCVECGQFVSYEDLETGRASRNMITPDSYFSIERFETICGKCNNKSK